jgi:DNA topoisomerase-2
MATPIVKATKGKYTKPFYTQFEYEEWKKTDESRGWKVK